MGAPSSGAPCYEIHHTIPQYLLRLREKAAGAALDGAGIEAWLDYEHEAMRYEVDPDVGTDELAALIDASTVPLERDEHRAHHGAAGDFVRWGSRGGSTTLERYGRAWFALLALRRWGKIAPAELDLALASARA